MTEGSRLPNKINAKIQITINSVVPIPNMAKTLLLIGDQPEQISRVVGNYRAILVPLLFYLPGSGKGYGGIGMR